MDIAKENITMRDVKQERKESGNVSVRNSRKKKVSDIKDQIELCKTALRKAMGHLARLEQLLKSGELYSEDEA